MRIAEILHRKGRTVHKTRTVDTVVSAAQILTAQDIGCLLVYDRWGRYVGILSERDISHGLARFGEETMRLPVSELMTADVISCHPEDRVRDALRVMTTHRIRHLPVDDDGAVVGIVSIGDLVLALLDEKALEVDVLRDIVRAH
ncbi:MAG: inosine-5-monophosphate dehydrogenase [Rhodospirillales bacterium]|jgi:CBS domain-containing protein|nr:inosine-5-monophosphate dehydrogenase [Rhodospirillales bacterium]